MRSTFSGLEIARSGLRIHQRALDITGHNIANADTKGYTRQRLITSSVDPLSGVNFIRNPDTALVGGGVKWEFIDQIRDVFLDKQLRQEQSELGFLSTKAQYMGYIENFYNERLETGISNGISKFFDAWMDLSNGNAPDKTLREVIIGQGLNLLDSFVTIGNKLEEYQMMQNQNIEMHVDRINIIARDIAAYNDAIYNFERTGAQANDLRDKRNLLLDELSELVNIDYTEQDDKLIVTLEGSVLVDHIATHDLSAVIDQANVNPVTGEYDLFEIQWAETGTSYKNGRVIEDTITNLENSGVYTGSVDDTINGDIYMPEKGIIKGHFDLRDGNTKESKGIPYFLSRLDDLVNDLAKAVNDLHEAGYTRPDHSLQTNDPAYESQTGIAFFVTNSADGKFRVRDIAINKDIIDNPNFIAASDAKIILNSESTNLANNNNAKAIGDIITKLCAENGQSTLDGFLRVLVAEVAVEAEGVNKSLKRQIIISNQMENQKQSISGVLLDEEMVSMIQFTHAYSASSRMITTMDEILDQIINRMGLVGLR